MTQERLFAVEQTTYTTDDYYTPKWIFDALGLTFDIDVASPPGGPPFTPCKAFYTQADDGLVQPWHGLVWMNPPYSNPSPWVDRWLDHGNGVALLPMAKSRWFVNLWNAPKVSMVNVHDHNNVGLMFHRNGRLTPIFMPVVALAIGEPAREALKNSGFGKVR